VERARDTTTSWRLRPVRRRPLVSSGIGVQRRAGEQPGARQHDVAGLVQDLGGRRPGGDQRLEVAADEHRPPGRAVLGRHLGELVGDDPPQEGRVGEQRLEVGDGRPQRGELGLQLGHLQRHQAPQLHVEHVAGLQLGQPDLRDELRPRLGDVLRGPDDPHHLVDVHQRDEQALDQVAPLLRLAQPVARAPGDDVDPVVEEDLQQVLQPERAGLAVDQRRRC
jgi:hypothetical protein